MRHGSFLGSVTDTMLVRADDLGPRTQIAFADGGKQSNDTYPESDAEDELFSVVSNGQKPLSAAIVIQQPVHSCARVVTPALVSCPLPADCPGDQEIGTASAACAPRPGARRADLSLDHR